MVLKSSKFIMFKLSLLGMVCALVFHVSPSLSFVLSRVVILRKERPRTLVMTTSQTELTAAKKPRVMTIPTTAAKSLTWRAISSPSLLHPLENNTLVRDLHLYLPPNFWRPSLRSREISYFSESDLLGARNTPPPNDEQRSPVAQTLLGQPNCDAASPTTPRVCAGLSV